MSLIYEFASKSHSRRVHEHVYGPSASSNFRAVGLDDTFEFECKMTGNCCRGRALSSNVVAGAQEVLAIRKYCEETNRPIRGINGKTLWLDGLDPLERQRRVATRERSPGVIGFAYVGPHGADCQFLDGNLCGIHPVKPVLCRLAPIGMVIEHEKYGGVVNLGFHEHKKQLCPECMSGPVRIVRDWISGIITDRFLNDERERCGHARIGPG